MFLVSLNVRKTENSAGWTTYGTFLVVVLWNILDGDECAHRGRFAHDASMRPLRISSRSESYTNPGESEKSQAARDVEWRLMAEDAAEIGGSESARHNFLIND